MVFVLSYYVTEILKSYVIHSKSLRTNFAFLGRIWFTYPEGFTWESTKKSFIILPFLISVSLTQDQVDCQLIDTLFHSVN